MTKAFVAEFNFDFVGALKLISQESEIFFPDISEAELESLSEDINRACRIRNRYSHQHVDIRRFDDDIKCLKNIATFIGANDVVEKIEEYIDRLSGIE